MESLLGAGSKALIIVFLLSAMLSVGLEVTVKEVLISGNQQTFAHPSIVRQLRPRTTGGLGYRSDPAHAHEHRDRIPAARRGSRRTVCD